LHSQIPDVSGLLEDRQPESRWAELTARTKATGARELADAPAAERPPAGTTPAQSAPAASAKLRLMDRFRPWNAAMMPASQRLCRRYACVSARSTALALVHPRATPPLAGMSV